MQWQGRSLVKAEKAEQPQHSYDGELEPWVVVHHDCDHPDAREKADRAPDDVLLLQPPPAPPEELSVISWIVVPLHMGKDAQWINLCSCLNTALLCGGLCIQLTVNTGNLKCHLCANGAEHSLCAMFI